jgi:acyl-CoA thioesterase FadM
MARVKLSLPAVFGYSTEIPVRISDVNYGGHLGNDAVLSLAQEARLRFLAQFGYSETNLEGLGLIMADAVVVYKAQGFYGDVLTVEVAVADITRLGWDFFYRLTNRETGKEIARVKTGMVVFDYANHKICPVPGKFRDLCAPPA